MFVLFLQRLVFIVALTLFYTPKKSVTTGPNRFIIQNFQANPIRQNNTITALDSIKASPSFNLDDDFAVKKYHILSCLPSEITYQSSSDVVEVEIKLTNVYARSKEGFVELVIRIVKVWTSKTISSDDSIKIFSCNNITTKFTVMGNQYIVFPMGGINSQLYNNLPSIRYMCNKGKEYIPKEIDHSRLILSPNGKVYHQEIVRLKLNEYSISAKKSLFPFDSATFIIHIEPSSLQSRLKISRSNFLAENTYEDDYFTYEHFNLHSNDDGLTLRFTRFRITERYVGMFFIPTYILMMIVIVFYHCIHPDNVTVRVVLPTATLSNLLLLSYFHRNYPTTEISAIDIWTIGHILIVASVLLVYMMVVYPLRHAERWRVPVQPEFPRNVYVINEFTSFRADSICHLITLVVSFVLGLSFIIMVEIV